MQHILEGAARLIVDKRRTIAAVVVLLAVASLMLVQRVNVNDDMTEYLADGSSMKAGLDIIEGEFPENESAQTLRVMFEGVPEEDKEALAEGLAAIPGVDEVDFDAGDDDHNRDGYSLYILETSAPYGSGEFEAIEEELDRSFSDHGMIYKSGDTSIEGIDPLIVALAFAILMVILFAMCASWVEPFLFLAVIMVAIVLNMGTNALMPSISNITFSIAAILQLVLSMDYSIMVMNRYRQERAADDDKASAMKRALAQAIPSVASSSTTTIVGLLMLAFMAFKIGADLGFVLAKGVFLSLMCILTLLPALILACDGAIQRMAKPVLHVPTGRLAAFERRARIPITLAFALMFGGFYVLQGETPTAFTLERDDPIAEVFPPTDTLAIVYDNRDEDGAARLAEWLEGNPHVKQVLGMPTTLDKPLTVGELAADLADMEGAAEIDEGLLRMVYYHRFEGGATPSLTAAEFLSFLADDMLADPELAGSLDGDPDEMAAVLRKFADPQALTTAMTASQLADFFGLGTSQAEQLLLLNAIETGRQSTATMTLPEFYRFASSGMPEEYASLIDGEARDSISQLALFTDVAAVTKKRDYRGIAEALGIPAGDAEMLFVYRQALDPSYEASPMTLAAFATYLTDDLASDPQFSSAIEPGMAEQAERLKELADADRAQRQMTPGELASFLGMDEGMVRAVFALAAQGRAMGAPDTDAALGSDEGDSPSAPGAESPDGDAGPEDAGEGGSASPQPTPAVPETMSPLQFLDAILSNEAVSSQLGESERQQLAFARTVMQSGVDGTRYSPAQMAGLLSMDGETARLVYVLHDASQGAADRWRMTLQQALNFIAENKGAMGQSMDASALESIDTARAIVNGSVAGMRFGPEALASLLGIGEGDLSKLFLLYQSENGDTGGWGMSPQAFVGFLLADVAGNPDYADAIDGDALSDLASAKSLIDAVVGGDLYSSEQMAALMGGIADDLDPSTIELAYLYRAAIYDSDPEWRMSILDLFDYLTGVILDDPLFGHFIDEATRADLIEAQDTLDEARAQMQGPYNSLLMVVTDYPAESDETTAFMDELTQRCERELPDGFHLVGNAAMNYEMQQSFGREMALITLLTSLAIFAVVALTFRSLVIPAILVLLIQCGIYITVTAVGLQGFSIYYLALLIVECILMGATVDYAILFTNYYREHRATQGPLEALKGAYEGSLHTILTSGLIIVVVVGIVGNFFENPVIGQICTTLSLGAFCACMLILFVLPGVLSAFDRFVAPKRRCKEQPTPNMEESGFSA